MGGTVGLGRQMMFWIAAFVALALVLYLLSPIILPFVAGMALAYMFNPLAGRLERLGLHRAIASLAVLIGFLLVFIALLLLLAPMVSEQFAALVDNLPDYIRRLQSLVTDPSRPWLRDLMGEESETSLGDIVRQSAGWMTAFLGGLWSGGQAIVSLVSLLVVTPVVAFYLLYDWDRMVATVDGWIPLHNRGTVRRLAREMDQAIAGFLRGQAAVCLILGSFYAIGLTLTGLNFGVLIGIISGLITFIPYIGSMTGLVLSAGIAFAQFWPDWTWILLILAVFFAGQFLESYVLVPKLVGDSVGLHPVWLMFALFAFGYLFGFVGLLAAVPMAAAVGVLARFAMEQYLASRFYTGEEPKTEPPAAAGGPLAVPEPAAGMPVQDPPPDRVG